MKITDRTFGVEIEFVGSAGRHELVLALRAEGLNAEEQGWSESRRDYGTDQPWKITTDASIGYDRENGELVSPILKGEEGFTQLEKACKALANVGAKINKRCGLHVHLGCGDLTIDQIKNIHNRYAQFEDQIDMMMPRSRRGENVQYVGSLKSNSRQESVKALTDKAHTGRTSKYHKLNIANSGKSSGTIEFRHHSGTTDFVKISNWVSFAMQFVEASNTVLGGGTVQRDMGRNTWFREFRQLLQNMDMTIKYERRYDEWAIRRNPKNFHPSTAMYVNTAELKSIYSAKSGYRMAGLLEISSIRHKLGRFGFDAREIEQMQSLQDAGFHKKRKVAADAIEDKGLMTGLDASTQEYIEQRTEQLN